MRKTLLLLACAMPLAAQDGFDFKTLDKLGDNAKNKTVITLDGDMLKMASGFLSNGGKSEADSIKPLVDSLTGVYIRSFEFDKEGQYNDQTLEPLRAYLKQASWNKIVESREPKEYSEIYLHPIANGRLGGIAVISAEPREVTVVLINGNLKQEDLAKLSGNMGIPDLKLNKKNSDKTPKGKKDDEE